MKLCTVCGVVTSRSGSRCAMHARQSNRSRHNAFYNTREWQHLSARVLRAWRGRHGNWCPGYGRAAHPAIDLTADHIVALAAGGAPLDVGNVAVLCRSCNSTKGDGSRHGRSAGAVALVASPAATAPRGPTWAPTGERGGIR
jgi:5-methylcytosine-specific restriction endonuclease McrA